MLLLLAGLMGTAEASAIACTYREAVMAMEQGNTVRGLALMRMASRDGDRRADDFLLNRGYATHITKAPTFAERSGLLKSASLRRDLARQ